MTFLIIFLICAILASCGSILYAIIWCTGWKAFGFALIGYIALEIISRVRQEMEEREG